MPSNAVKRRIQYFWFRIYEVYTTQRLPRSNSHYLKHKRIIDFTVSAMLNLVKDTKKRYKISRIALKHATKYNNTGCKYVRCNATGILIEKEDIFNTIRVPYENTELEIPRGYDKILKLAKSYGNYMVYPKVEQRKPSIEYVFYDLNSACEKYKGIYYCV